MNRDRMSHVIVIHPPDAAGGRRVHVGATILGMARSLRDLQEFLRRGGLDWEPEQITASPLVEWRGGGPETWD
ncbi:hypothetical protein ACIPY6_41580 [Streptomyces sp. NPDC090054]|uniref:hypothetical protein n=1 Tax=Streptomyces sp. NPDC090054 TaxID=3365933 RepID=UPI00381AD60D